MSFRCLFIYVVVVVHISVIHLIFDDGDVKTKVLSGTNVNKHINIQPSKLPMSKTNIYLISNWTVPLQIKYAFLLLRLEYYCGIFVKTDEIILAFQNN